MYALSLRPNIHERKIVHRDLGLPHARRQGLVGKGGEGSGSTTI